MWPSPLSWSRGGPVGCERMFDNLCRWEQVGDPSWACGKLSDAPAGRSPRSRCPWHQGSRWNCKDLWWVILAHRPSRNSVGIITEERASCCGQPRIPVPVIRIKSPAISMWIPRSGTLSGPTLPRVVWVIRRLPRPSRACLPTLRVRQWPPCAAAPRQAQRRDLWPCGQGSLCRIPWTGGQSGDKI